MTVTINYTESIEKATRLTPDEIEKWRIDAKLSSPHTAINVDIFYLMFRIQRLVSYCGIVCNVPDTNIMKDFINELKGFEIPNINLSAIPVKPHNICRIKPLKEWRPNIIEMYYGMIYDDIHKDPLFTGFQGAIFVQSSHIQDMCLAYESEVWSDERYDTPKIRQRRKDLKSVLTEINDRDVNLKTASERMLEIWDDKYEKYKKALLKLTNRLNSAYVKMYKSLGHEDPIVASIFATIYTLAYFYKKSLTVTRKQLELKYEYKLDKFLDEFSQMAEKSKEIRKECDKIVSFNRKEMFSNEQIPDAPGILKILKEIARLIEDNDFWQETIGDKKYL